MSLWRRTEAGLVGGGGGGPQPHHQILLPSNSLPGCRCTRSSRTFLVLCLYFTHVFVLLFLFCVSLYLSSFLLSLFFRHFFLPPSISILCKSFLPFCLIYLFFLHVFFFLLFLFLFLCFAFCSSLPILPSCLLSPSISVLIYSLPLFLFKFSLSTIFSVRFRLSSSLLAFLVSLVLLFLFICCASSSFPSAVSLSLSIFL